MSKLVLVSNRLPVTVIKHNNVFEVHPSDGGLSTGLRSIQWEGEVLWIGGSGFATEGSEEEVAIEQLLMPSRQIPVPLNKAEMDLFYSGFCNQTIWPLFHYFTQYTHYSPLDWECYQQINQRFTEYILKHSEPSDLLWIHDYHLMLVPAMIRAVWPDVRIGFFLHIPFPSYEIYRTLPWRSQLLKGMLGADVIGFHTFDYLRHFLSAAYRIEGHENEFGKMQVQGRVVNAEVFPMGIDYERYANPEQFASGEDIQQMLDRFSRKERTLILSIDRLDYTKGIIQRLLAFEQLLLNYPEYISKVTLLLIVVPSRDQVPQYTMLKEEIDTMVGRIDGQYRTFGWSPVQYFYRSFSFEALSALYQAASIALITPLRDGMNLVAKEFVAAKSKTQRGVLVLSEMAGAAAELGEALLVNPHDKEHLVDTLHKALTMSEEEQEQRLQRMQKRLAKNTVHQWARDFLSELNSPTPAAITASVKLWGNTEKLHFQAAYHQSLRRLIFLDYDGTLVEFKNNPLDAYPDVEILEILQTLTSQPANKVVIISGRDKKTLQDWLGHIPRLELVAEHGAWQWRMGHWTAAHGLKSEWKQKIRPVLEAMVERTPASFIEEKDFSLVWHYRATDASLGERRIREYKNTLQYLTVNLGLQVLEGNKIVEVRDAVANKGQAALQFVGQGRWDCIMAMGDDKTDEDLFKSLPGSSWTFKVGAGTTHARYQLPGIIQCRQLLKELLVEKVV